MSHSNLNLYLDRVVNGVARNGYIALDSSDENAPKQPVPFRIAKVSEKSLKDFGISGKATGMLLNDLAGNAVDNSAAVTAYPWANWPKTTVYFQSEALTLSDAPIPEPIVAASEPAS